MISASMEARVFPSDGNQMKEFASSAKAVDLAVNGYILGSSAPAQHRDRAEVKGGDCVCVPNPRAKGD